MGKYFNVFYSFIEKGCIIRKKLNVKYDMIVSKNMNALNTIIFAHKTISSLIKSNNTNFLYHLQKR